MADEFSLIPDQYIDSADIYNVINDKSVSFQYLGIRGGVLEDVLGLEDVLEDTF